MGKEKYSVVIIGAGNIAAGFDNPNDEFVLTHAHAITNNKRLMLVGFFDTNIMQSRSAARKWNVNSFDSLNSLRDINPDIVIICTPDGTHYSMLQEVLTYEPKLVLCEKPLTLSISDSITIGNLYKERGVSLLVNYQRRFDDSINNLKQQYLTGSTGRILGASLFYSKGIIHNGSHALDLFHYLFGDTKAFIITEKKYDFYENDPSVGGTLFYDDLQIHLIPADERSFSIFEIEFLFEKERYRFINSGMEYEYYQVHNDPIFEGYKEQKFISRNMSGLPYSLNQVANELVSMLDNYHLSRISALNAVKAQRVAEQLSKADLFNRVVVNYLKILN